MIFCRKETRVIRVEFEGYLCSPVQKASVVLKFAKGKDAVEDPVDVDLGDGEENWDTELLDFIGAQAPVLPSQVVQTKKNR